jgi:hypothetical protein
VAWVTPGGWQEDLTPAKLRHKAYYQHVLHGLDLLYSLCTLGDTFPRIANATLVSLSMRGLRNFTT